MVAEQALHDAARGQAPGVSLLGPTAEHAIKAVKTLAGSPQDSLSELLLRSVPASPIVKAVAQ